MSTFNVRDYGALGDYVPATGGGTDDAASFNAAFAAALASGGTIEIPKGNYKIGNPLVLDTSALTGFLEDGRVNIEGEGSHCARLFEALCPGETLLSFKGGTFGTGGQWSRFKIGGIHLVGSNPLPAGGVTGLDMDHAIFVEKNDVEISQFYQAEKCRDVIGMKQDFCRWTYNNYGQLFDDDWTDSAVNEVVSTGCHWSNNRQYGLWANTGGNLVFNGGSVENNGNAGAWDSDASRWGMRFTNCGQFSVVATNMNGVHFEGQANEADIWIEHGDWPTVYNILGADFFRVGNVNYAKNNIRFDTTGLSAADLLLVGCGFHAVNGYVASSARRRVAYGYVSGNLHRVMATGCRGLESSLIDAPTMINSIGWSPPTGPSSRATFNTNTVSTSRLAQGFKALIDELTSAGFLRP